MLNSKYTLSIARWERSEQDGQPELDEPLVPCITQPWYPEPHALLHASEKWYHSSL